MSSAGHLSELDLLRGQVADLSRQLVERDRSMQDLREQSQRLRTIAEGTASETGDEFFASLVTRLTSTLHMQYAVIGEVLEVPFRKIRTLAVSAGDTLIDNFEYELAHTPCAIALTQTFTCFDRDLQATFPQFQRLADLGAESYCAVPLWTKSGAVIGLLVVMDTKPLEHSDDLQSLLGVFAPRIAAEFERRRAEQEHAEALADLHNAMEMAPDIMFTLDTQGNMVRWNQRVKDVTGYSQEELLNKPALAFVPTEEQARTAAAIQRAFTDGYAELEGHLLTKDHRVIPYHWTGALLKSSHGEPIGITGIGRDVSDKKRAEEALHKSEQRFALAVEGSNDILWDAHRLPGEPWYAPQTPIWWSSRVRELLGLQESDSFETFEQWVVRLHPDDKDHVFGQLAAHIEHRVPYDVEYRLRTNAGGYCWIRGRGQALWDEQGEPRRMSGSCQDITERKQAEEVLQKNRAYLQSFAEHTPAAVAMLDRDLNYVAVSRRWYQDYRLVDRDIIGLHHYDVFPEIQKMEHWQAIHRRCLAGEILKSDEDRFCREDGRDDWLRWEIRPWVDEFGSIGGIIMFTEDITERKRAELVLREREEVLARFKATLDQTHDCVFMFAPDTLSFIYCNRGAVEQVGYSEVELFTMTPLDLKSEFTERSFREMLQQLKDGRMDSHVFETIHRHKDGHDVPVEVSLQLVREEGQKGRFLAVVRDITERKQAEKALRESEERFDLAVRGSNTGIWDWDLRTDKTYFSPLWKSMLGYEEHELKGEFFEWEERLHPDDRKRSSETVRAYLEGVAPQYELEHRLRHKDGSYRWILARGVSLSDAEGKPYRMAGSHIDITEQKQTQEALIQSERQLRTVLDALPVGVWFTDRAGKPLLANPAAKQIWSNIKQIGLQTENPQASWWEAIGPINEPHRWALSYVLTTGVPAQYETFNVECLDGTKKAIRNLTVPVKSEDGLILGAIVLNEDITMLRQAQAALQLTQFSVDHAVEGFLWVESDARIFHANDSICRMLEYTCEEFMTMTLHDIDPNLTSEVWPAYWEELKKKGSLTFESKYWSRTGRVLDMEVTINYLQYEGKEYNCAIMRDIGERKRAQEALRASEERYRLLYDETPTMYFTLAVDGTVRSVNRFGAEQLGYQVEELIGHSVLSLFHEDDKEAVAASLSESVATPEAMRQWEFRRVRKDGNIIWVRETVRAGQSSAGETLVLVASEDITEHRRMEDALRQRERDLRAAFEERVRISQDLHDGILQSLFAVGLTLEASKSTMTPAVRKISGAPLNQAIHQLNQVMREIRNFIAGMGSDLLQGKDLPAALKQMLASLTEHQSTRVRLAVEDRAAKALSTEQSLHLIRVIQEAVSNCIKHGHAQEARVSLKMLKQGVRLSIRDNGCGFNLNRAKETGHGLRNMTTRAQKIGGRFTILSKVNEGTSIVLDLPNEAADVSR